MDYYILWNKQTNVIEDISTQPFPVTDDFEWIKETKVTQADVKKIYNKQTKQITERPPQPQRPSELSNVAIVQKLEELEGKIDAKEPSLGIVQKTQDYGGWVFSGFLIILIIIFAFTRRKK